MDISKEKQNKKVLKELNKMVELVPEDRQAIAKQLVKEIAFISRTLDELKDAIEENGAIDLFKQGSQEFLRESPALKAYNTTIQRYSLLYKQFTDLLPKQAQDNLDSALCDFIKMG